jgi:hypothetical protein
MLVIPRPYKICDWLGNSSWDHFRLHQEKHVIVIMEFEVPKSYFKAYIIHWHGPNNLCGGRGKRGALVGKGKGPWHRNIVIIKIQWNFFGGREDEDKRTVQLEFLLKTALSKHVLKNSVRSLFGAWSFLLVHIGLHLVRGPKALQIVFLRNQTMKVGPPSRTME